MPAQRAHLFALKNEGGSDSGALTSSQVSGGEHWGSPGSGNNVFEGAVVRTGRRIECWLRTIHSQDLDTFGVAVAITLD